MHYDYAAVGVAISDNPTGPFKYLRSFRPNNCDSRDMTVFKDDDGEAYLFYSSEMNKTMHITPLSEDYLGVGDHFSQVFVGQSREAPAVFKHKMKYCMITSGCTGWEANEAQYAVAESIYGPWTVKGSLCTGENSARTFGTQGTYVFPIIGKQDACIFMADLWKKQDLRESRYIWLPVRFKGDSISVGWMGKWNLSVFD